MKRIPDQLIRLSVPFLFIILALLIIKQFVTPETFGDLGHYRAAAIEDISSIEPHYAGFQACLDCHEDIMEVQQGSYHRNISCEVCHEPSLEHVNDPTEHLPPAPRERGFCPLCHNYLDARPTGFPQIITMTHNPGKPCINCHDPHDPTPPHVPGDCAACHRQIARTKMVSHHVDIQCTECHDTPEEHMINPRLSRAMKPADREFCGGCHAEDAQKSVTNLRIDIDTHGGVYVCWECHYPHLPEAPEGGAPE